MVVTIESTVLSRRATKRDIELLTYLVAFHSVPRLVPSDACGDALRFEGRQSPPGVSQALYPAVAGPRSSQQQDSRRTGCA